MNQKNQVVNYKLVNVNECRDTDLTGFIYCLMIDLKSIDDGYNSIIQIDGINYNVNESVIDYLIEQIEEVRKDSYIILNGIKEMNLKKNEAIFSFFNQIPVFVYVVVVIVLFITNIKIPKLKGIAYVIIPILAIILTVLLLVIR